MGHLAEFARAALRYPRERRGHRNQHPHQARLREGVEQIISQPMGACLEGLNVD